MSTQLDASIPVPVVEGRVPHILIVRAPYNAQIVDGLRDGAAALIAAAGGTCDVLDVAGALELAATIVYAVRGSNRYDGFVALGCVIKGETDHYDHVCREAMQGLTRVALDHTLALGNGLLTVATEEQALARSGSDGHNKGAEAAAACLRQISAGRYLGAME
jgi:6,7-dimethyl-8-ribityllumazine synthase